MAEWREVTLDPRGRVLIPKDIRSKKKLVSGQKLFIQVAVEVEAKKS